jgi:hypothetical protein
MTEDDTFLALRKPSYAEMYQLWSNSDLIKESSGNYFETQVRIKAFFNQYGWDVREYSDMCPNSFTTD